MGVSVGSNGKPSDMDTSKVAYLYLDLKRPAGTYDLGVVSGGDILITRAAPYNVDLAGGLVSIAIQTDDTIPTAILAVTLAAAMLKGKNLTVLNTPFVLPRGQKIQCTIVGDGSAGQIYLAVEYRPLQAGAVLS